jgi:hypothetical protein
MNEKDKIKQKLERESAKLRPQVTGLREPESKLVWTEDRIEQQARSGEILVTQAVKERLGDKLQLGSHWIDRIKGTGNTAIYQVIGVKES